MKKSNLKKIIAFILKLSFVITLCFYLFKKGYVSLSDTKTALFQFNYIIPAFAFLMICTVLGIFRWKYLLQTQQIILPTSRIFKLGLIGNFFNVALPGAVTGDIIKAVYTSKEAPDKRAYALSSILFDRFIGVSALILISFFSVLFSFFSASSKTLPAPFVLFVAGLGSLIFLFFIYLFLIPNNRDPIYKLLSKFKNKHNIINSLLRVIDGIKIYSVDKKCFAITLMISFIIHFLVISTVMLFLFSFGKMDLPFIEVMIVVPVGLLLIAVPISPGGVGTGHAAFLGVFHLIGFDRGADVFTLFFIFKLFEGFVGAIVYLQFKAHITLPKDTVTAI